MQWLVFTAKIPLGIILKGVHKHWLVRLPPASQLLRWDLLISTKVQISTIFSHRDIMDYSVAQLPDVNLDMLCMVSM